MTSSALQRSTQQTATQKSPVYEYSCLFTHDIRRKNTKRWQDGFLRFHFFNNRVMVYDQSRNYIGDTHFQDAGHDGLEDGDELKLERGGVLVQVGERLSTGETDLSDLLAKRQPKPAANEPVPSRPTAITPNPRAVPHLQPKSANITPITPGKRTGFSVRAQIPKNSPFDFRRLDNAAAAANVEWESTRAAKRQRLNDNDEHVPLWQILKPSKPSREVPLAANVTPNPKQKAVSKSSNRRIDTSTTGRQTLPRARGIVDLVSSPSSPANCNSDSPFPTSVAKDTHNRTGLSTKQLSRISKRDAIATLPDMARHTPIPSRSNQNSSSPPVSTTSRLPALDEAALAKQQPTEAAETSRSPKRKTKPLRLATAAPRKMLYCQTMGVVAPPKDPSQIHRGSPVTGPTNTTESDRRAAEKRRSKNNNATAIPDTGEQTAQQEQVASEAAPNRIPTNVSTPRHDLDNPPAKSDLQANNTPQVPASKQPKNRTPTSNTSYGTSPSDTQFLLASAARLLPLAPPKHAAQTAASPAPSPGASAAPLAAAKPGQPSPRRHSFDVAAASPPKLAAQAVRRSPIKRAETISGPPSLRRRAGEATVATAPDNANSNSNTGAASRAGSRRPSLQAAEALKDEDVGPWSREAWDLFGWCPEGRGEALGWAYEAPAAPPAAAVVR